MFSIGFLFLQQQFLSGPIPPELSVEFWLQNEQPLLLQDGRYLLIRG